MTERVGDAERFASSRGVAVAELTGCTSDSVMREVTVSNESVVEGVSEYDTDDGNNDVVSAPVVVSDSEPDAETCALVSVSEDETDNETESDAVIVSLIVRVPETRCDVV